MDGQAGFKVPGTGVTVEVTISIKDGAFNGAEGEADGIDVPVPGTEGLLNIDSIGAGFTINPVAFAGSIGLSGGPEILGHAAISDDGGFDIAFNAPITVGPIGDIIPQPITYDNVPFYFSVHGSTELAGEIPLGSSIFNLLVGPGFTPVVTFAGGIGPLGGPGCDPNNPLVSATCTPQGYSISVAGLTLAQLQLTLDGVLYGDHFNAEGSGSVSVLGLGLSGEALISTKGLAACAQLGSLKLASDARAAAAGSGAAGAGARAFAADVVASAQPRALAALSGPRRSSQLALDESELSHLQAEQAAFTTATENQIQAIVSSAERNLASSASSAHSGVLGSARGYASGRATQETALNGLLTDASNGSAALQADAINATNALQQLRNRTLTQLQAYSQQIDALQAQIDLLQGDGARIASDDVIATEASIGGDIAGIFKKGWDDLTGALAGAAKDVGDAISSAAQTIGGLASDAAANFQTALQPLLQDIAQLGQQAEQALEQFAEDVKSAAITIADDVANLFDGNIGVGYTWGGTPTFYPTGGCSVGPYVDETGLQPQRAALLHSDIASVRAHAAAASTFKLTSGTQFVVLRFAGRRAADRGSQRSRRA